jgi:hypothetical protein
MTSTLRCGAPLLTSMLIAAATAGCETFGPHPCDPTPAANPVQTYKGGAAQDGVYTSSTTETGGSTTCPGTGTVELLAFPAGAHYLMEHHLPGPPTLVLPSLSFSECATPGSGAATTLGGGNEAEILGITCTTIEISNDTCSDFWLLLTAEGAPATCDCPDGGSSTPP